MITKSGKVMGRPFTKPPGPASTAIRVDAEVRDLIARNAVPYEPVYRTLRRMLGLDKGKCNGK